MIRQLLFFVVFIAVGTTLRAWGSEEAVSPIIRFGDPSDGARISVENARFSLITGAGVNDGRAAVRVDFAAADRAELAIRPVEEPADWSGMWALAMPEPVDLLVRVGDDPNAGGDQHALTGRARVRAGEAVVLLLPLRTTDGLPMGMRAAPAPTASRLDSPVRLVGGGRGALDRRHVMGINLILLERSLGRTLIFGDLGVIRGADPGREAYWWIVDGFGQYTRAR